MNDIFEDLFENVVAEDNVDVGGGRLKDYETEKSRTQQKT